MSKPEREERVTRRRIVFRRWSVWLLTLYDVPATGVKGARAEKLIGWLAR